MGLARYGFREMILLTVVLGLLAAAAAMLHWTIAAMIGVVWLAGLAFFRDPHRTIPSEPDLLVAPADGVVTELTTVDNEPNIGGPATRVGIFLSVFDVHINRSPCNGRVLRSVHRPGEFLDARHPDSGARNESNTLVLDPEGEIPGPIVVRQVAGLIARRIVCAVGPEAVLQRGERFGMIKFGSRTELIVPRDGQWNVAVEIGQKVRGGATVIMKRTVTSADERNNETRPTTKAAAAAR